MPITVPTAVWPGRWQSLFLQTLGIASWSWSCCSPLGNHSTHTSLCIARTPTARKHPELTTEPIFLHFLPGWSSMLTSQGALSSFLSSGILQMLIARVLICPWTLGFCWCFTPGHGLFGWGSMLTICVHAWPLENRGLFLCLALSHWLLGWLVVSDCQYCCAGVACFGSSHMLPKASVM